jgi:serine/threonine protein kinase
MPEHVGPTYDTALVVRFRVPTRPHEFFNATSATTRATQSLQRFARQSQYLLVPQQVITSPESGLKYRIERLLGQGGFGQVFLAARQGRSQKVPAVVCIKVSSHIDGWLR